MKELRGQPWLTETAARGGQAVWRFSKKQVSFLGVRNREAMPALIYLVWLLDWLACRVHISEEFNSFLRASILIFPNELERFQVPSQPVARLRLHIVLLYVTFSAASGRAVRVRVL